MGARAGGSRYSSKELSLSGYPLSARSTASAACLRIASGISGANGCRGMKLNWGRRSSILAHQRQTPAMLCHRSKCSHQQRSSSLLGVFAIADFPVRGKVRGQSVDIEGTRRPLALTMGRFLYLKSGAEGRSRTDMGLPPPVFECGAGDAVLYCSILLNT